MSQTKAQLVSGLSINASAPATALQIDASGNINLDSNTLYVDATNNRVGLGTSTVGSLLHLSQSGGNAKIFIQRSDSANNSDDYGSIVWRSSGNYNNGGIGVARQSGEDNGYMYFSTGSGGTLSERVRITSGGLVGIGTTSPRLRAHIRGDSANAPTLGVASGSLIVGPNDNDYGMMFGVSGSGWGWIQTQNFVTPGGTAYNLALQPSGGNVGIGTTSPSAKLHSIGGATSGGVDTAGIFTGGVVNTTGSGARIYLSGSPGYETLRGVYLEGVVDDAGNAHSLRFATNANSASPTERMRITNAGWAKVSNNGSYDNVNGTYHEFNSSVNDWTFFVRNTNASPTGIAIRYTGASPNGTGNEFLYCYDSGNTLRASIRSNGGLANFSANNVNLSDINAKKDIAPAAGTWNCLKEWEIVNFRYKDQSDDADLNMGVIAQQVAESCPEVITVFQEAKEATETEPAQEERLGVKDQQMMWMAIKALQEAQLRIETLEAEVAALKGA